MSYWGSLFPVLVGVVLLFAGCDKAEPPGQAPPSGDLEAYLEGPIQPLPLRVPVNVDEVELGRRLFLDPRLSHDDTVACASCHPIDSRYGADGLRVSVGIEGRTGVVNAPTVLNSGYNFRQFWDGRARTLEEQVGGPLLAHAEMGTTWSEVIDKLQADASLNGLARKVYGRAIDQDTIQGAIAAFERSLVTPDAPFDRFLRGDAQAISTETKAGWRLFQDIGCIACHQGINIGGNMFANLGVMGSYFDGRQVTPADLGLFNQTGLDRDRFKFKVPSMRNITKTGPYFHDGRIKALDDAVTTMARTQLGLELSAEERLLIIAFLESLTGRLPEVAP